MSTVNIFQISLEIWGCLICVIAAIASGNKAYEAGGVLRRLWSMLLINGLMLVSDALGYVFYGDVRSFAVVMSRVGNFALFFCEGQLAYQYVKMVQALCYQEDEETPGWVKCCIAAIALQLLGILLTPFTGLYYSFDSHNYYQREPGIFLSFGSLGVVFVINSIQMFRHRRYLSSALWQATRISMVIFVVCLLVQMLSYGLSLISISVTIVLLLLFITLWMEAQRQQIQGDIDHLENIIAELRESKE